MTWKYLLYAQFPAFFLLAVFFLVCYIRVRQSSAVKSMLWVLLFGASLAVSILFLFLGVPEFWTLKTLFPLKAASWIGIVLLFVALIAHIVHVFDKKRSQKLMEKELERAAKEKDDAVAQAREEGRRDAQMESELPPQTAEPNAFDPMTGLPLNPAPAEPNAFDPMTGQPLNPAPAEPPAFDPMTGQPLNPAPAEPPAFDPMTGQPLNPAPAEPGDPTQGGNLP